MKRKLPEKFFEQNQRAKTRKWKFFNLNQALWGAGNREFRAKTLELRLRFFVCGKCLLLAFEFGRSISKRCLYVGVMPAESIW